MSLYKVGEEVILQSIRSPELNGDAVVLEVLSNEDNNKRLRRLVPNIRFPPEGGDVYILTTPAPGREMRGFAIPENAIPWGEKALRKKYKPGKSFEELMSTLQPGRVHNA